MREKRANKVEKTGIDSRALFATYIIKLPRLLILAVAGAVLGSGLSLIVALLQMQERYYVSETEYYVEFAEGQLEAKHHYNDFTWNDVLTSNEILGRAMELLGDGYDRSQVQEMLTADILSDVRYLTITVRGLDWNQVESVKNAIGTALEIFGQTKKEFDRIYKIDDLEIVQEEIPLFTGRAAFLGGILAVCAGIFFIALRFGMGSVFYTKRDITKYTNMSVYGMTFAGRSEKDRFWTIQNRQLKMLSENLQLLTQANSEVLLFDASGGREAMEFLRTMQSQGFADTTRFRIFDSENDKQTMVNVVFLAVIPFGQCYRERIIDEMDFVQFQGGSVAGAVLVKANIFWTAIYYANDKSRFL